MLKLRLTRNNNVREKGRLRLYLIYAIITCIACIMLIICKLSGAITLYHFELIYVLTLLVALIKDGLDFLKLCFAEIKEPIWFRRCEHTGILVVLLVIAFPLRLYEVEMIKDTLLPIFIDIIIDLAQDFWSNLSKILQVLAILLYTVTVLCYIPLLLHYLSILLPMIIH
ncbi:MAG: hypothetical protein DRN15_07225 [Thermoprotei archaeon]|nr:MAG: hypothetical protein DRN15_07225 [Thermoprotei archaeon]